MTTLRLLADDLTGAIDSAVRFVPLTGPVTVRWQSDRGSADCLAAAGDSLALDIVTREADGSVAAARAAAAAPSLHGADIAYLKCDSLLRGHPAEELLACFGAGRFRRCIVAPAFPAQCRRTRDGRQEAQLDGRWQVVGQDLAARLAASGHRTTLSRPGDPVPEGISLWDADSEDDLARIVHDARSGGVLWCGSAGLAGALAGGAPPPAPSPRRPVLALLGSDHAVTAQQRALASEWHVDLEEDPAPVATRLTRDGLAVVTVTLTNGVSRQDAAGRIAEAFARLPSVLPRPGTLFVTGGETLRRVCDGIGARALTAFAEVAPGVPVSKIDGGVWDGVPVVSKSGAFGTPDLIRRLLVSAT